MRIKNISLDSYQTNNLVKSSFGTKTNDHLEDNIINGPLSFARCYEEALQKKEFGAFLIITGNQYIFAKCYDDGDQGHMISVTKAFLELEGKNTDISVLEASRIYSSYAKKFLILELEIRKDEMSRKRDKYIRANLNQSNLSPEEYQSFKRFFEEYQDVISKCGFNYSIFDKKSGKILPIKNIFHLNTLLESVVDENTKAPNLENSEKIVGIPTNNQESNKML